MKLCTTSFLNDWPPLLQELVIQSLTIRCVVSISEILRLNIFRSTAIGVYFIPANTFLCKLSDYVNDNPLFEWLMDENLFELLGNLISNASLRRRFGIGACRLLGLISQYRWKEVGFAFVSFNDSFVLSTDE